MCSPLKSESGASILEHDGGLSEDESLRKAWAASVGRATAREIKTLSQALEAMGKPKFTLGSRPLVLGTGKRNSRGWGGVFFEGVGGAPGPRPPAALMGMGTPTDPRRFFRRNCYCRTGVPKKSESQNILRGF